MTGTTGDVGPGFRFSLYVVGGSARAEHAVVQFTSLCEELLAEGTYRIDVVDVIRHPEAADAARVIATPTVVREEPLPRRVVVGDLSARDAVRAVLGLGADARRRSPLVEHPGGPAADPPASRAFGRRRTDGGTEITAEEDRDER